MACMTGMEQQFLRTLEEVEHYCIQSSHLEMLDAAGTAVGGFESGDATLKQQQRRKPKCRRVIG